MAKRKLEELHLLDDFLFGSMVSHPQVGEEFIKLLLKIIFDREFGKMTVVPQKFYYGADTDKHGARIDVYLEEAPLEGAVDTATVYDMEPDKNSKTDAVAALPRRVRFYHAKIDENALESGESYKNLKNVSVILITPFDPFNYNRMVYTIRSLCEEVPSLPYDDGARTLFLYTKGTEGDPPEELRQLLHYMEYTKDENAVNDDLKTLNNMVNIVKHDKEVSLNYMKTMEWEEMLINQGLEQGRSQEQANTERERLRADSEARRADSEAQRADSEAQRADSEAQRADFEAQRADSEAQRAERAEKELTLLKKQLANLNSSS